MFLGSTVDVIHRDFSVYQHTSADWRRFATDVLVDYVETHTEKIGGPGKIVEIDESKIGKRKFNRGHFVEGQWVFGRVGKVLDTTVKSMVFTILSKTCLSKTIFFNKIVFN